MENKTNRIVKKYLKQIIKATEIDGTDYEEVEKLLIEFGYEIINQQLRHIKKLKLPLYKMDVNGNVIPLFSKLFKNKLITKKDIKNGK